MSYTTRRIRRNTAQTARLLDQQLAYTAGTPQWSKRVAREEFAAGLARRQARQAAERIDRVNARRAAGSRFYWLEFDAASCVLGVLVLLLALGITLAAIMN